MNFEQHEFREHRDSEDDKQQCEDGHQWGWERVQCTAHSAAVSEASDQKPRIAETSGRRDERMRVENEEEQKAGSNASGEVRECSVRRHLKPSDEQEPVDWKVDSRPWDHNTTIGQNARAEGGKIGGRRDRKFAVVQDANGCRNEVREDDPKAGRTEDGKASWNVRIGECGGGVDACSEVDGQGPENNECVGVPKRAGY